MHVCAYHCTTVKLQLWVHVSVHESSEVSGSKFDLGGRANFLNYGLVECIRSRGEVEEAPAMVATVKLNEVLALTD